MGAWATGTNTGIAMLKVAMVKNTGPDLDKIVDTLAHFGPDFDYLITAYPPFLKHLRDRLDSEGFDWPAYKIHGVVGGEALTEALRDYLTERFASVRSCFGASDLTIGMGVETGFTVWLRKELLADPELRAELIGADEQRLPMIFQYNPLDTYLEVNNSSELLCTVTSTHALQPKLRYNIGDEAALRSYEDVVRILKREPARWQAAMEATGGERMSLPLLLLYGRADSTISYMGANIYPQDVEYGLYEENPLAEMISRFSLSLVETADHESRPIVNIELRQPIGDPEREELAATCRAGVLRHLAKVSRDFAQHSPKIPPRPTYGCGSSIRRPALSRPSLRNSRTPTSSGKRVTGHEDYRLLAGTGQSPGHRDVHRRHPLSRPGLDRLAEPYVVPAGTRHETDARLRLAPRLLGVSVHPRHHRVLRGPGGAVAVRPQQTSPGPDAVDQRREEERPSEGGFGSTARRNPATHRESGALRTAPCSTSTPLPRWATKPPVRRSSGRRASDETHPGPYPP